MAKTYADLTVANATAGNAILASDFTTLFTNSNNYRVPPSCRVRPTTTRAFSGGGYVTFDTDSGEGCHDTDGMWDAGDPTKITISTAGIYVCTGSIYALSATGGAVTALQASITANFGGGGTATSLGSCSAVGVNSDTGAQVVTSAVVALSAGDFVRLGPTYINGTGTGLNISTTITNLSVTWVGQVS